MKKIIITLSAGLILTSCVVTTAAKVVKGVATAGYKVVKGTVNGVSWAVSKAKGKIDEDRIDGTWKIVGIYPGRFEDFEKDENPESNFTTSCADGFEQIEFQTKKERFKPVHCSTEDEDWTDYKIKFGKHPITKEKVNYLTYNNQNYMTVVDVTNKTMVLEGNLVPSFNFSNNTLVLLEKVK